MLTTNEKIKAAAVTVKQNGESTAFYVYGTINIEALRDWFMEQETSVSVKRTKRRNGSKFGAKDVLYSCPIRRPRKNGVKSEAETAPVG